ncbi:sensor histidine kinase [Sphingomonas sp. RS6]
MTDNRGSRRFVPGQGGALRRIGERQAAPRAARTTAAWLKRVPARWRRQPGGGRAGFRYPTHRPVLGPVRPLMLVILLGSAIVAGMLWIASLEMLARDRAEAIETAIRENNNRVVAYEQFVDRTLAIAQLALDHFAQTLPPIAAPAPAAAPPRLLDDPLARNPLFASVMVADAAGNVRSASVPGLPAMNIADRSGFRELQASSPAQRYAIGRTAMSAALGRPVVSIGRALFHPDGRFAGLVAVRIPVERFTDFNRDARTADSDLIALVRGDGVTLARRQGGRVSYGERIRDHAAVWRGTDGSSGAFVGALPTDGVRRLVSWRRLPVFDVVAATGVGESDLLAAVNRRRHRTFAFLGVITVALFAFAGLAMYGLWRRETVARDLAGTNDRLCEAQRIGGIGDWEYDVASDRLILSDHLCRMHGRDPADDLMPARAALRLVERGDRGRLLAAVRDAIVTRTPQSCDIQMCSGDRAVSHRRVRIVATGTGAALSLIGTEQDINAEKAHAALRDEVAHGARIEAMNLMAATIAHELAQPLTAASNYIAAARFAGTTNIELMRDLLGKARAQIGLTHRIVERARDMAANRRGESAAQVAEVVEEAVALLRIATPGCAVAFAFDLDPAAPWLAADKVQVQQVLLNLLRNAVQAVSGRLDGEVVVASRLQPDGMVQLSVSDNGPGLPADAPDIFSPFISSSRAGGLGLGLSICRAIVESYGGQIQAAPTNEGARISFSLPLLAVARVERRDVQRA